MRSATRRMVPDDQVDSVIVAPTPRAYGRTLSAFLLMPVPMVNRREFLSIVAAAQALVHTAQWQHPSTDGRQEDWRRRKRKVPVFGRTMAVVDTGDTSSADRSLGVTAVFIHGNPTSSYLWRNIVPGIAPLCRCVAPDLIGMGDSERLPSVGTSSYRFEEHIRYLDGLLELLSVGNRVVLVLHDWGGMLGFDWARRHADRVLGIAHMETVMDGLSSQTAPPAALEWFRRYRSEIGKQSVLQDNQFVEQVLLSALGDRLSDADRAEYRRPFARAGEDRLPTLMWPRELPIDGDPADVAQRFDRARAWLASSLVQKLFVNVEPGALTASPARKAICRSWPNTTEVTVSGGHFVQEQSPEAISQALIAWLTKIARRSPG